MVLVSSLLRVSIHTSFALLTKMAPHAIVDLTSIRHSVAPEQARRRVQSYTPLQAVMILPLWKQQQLQAVARHQVTMSLLTSKVQPQQRTTASLPQKGQTRVPKLPIQQQVVAHHQKWKIVQSLKSRMQWIKQYHSIRITSACMKFLNRGILCVTHEVIEALIYCEAQPLHAGAGLLISKKYD